MKHATSRTAGSGAPRALGARPALQSERPPHARCKTPRSAGPRVLQGGVPSTCNIFALGGARRRVVARRFIVARAVLAGPHDTGATPSVGGRADRGALPSTSRACSPHRPRWARRRPASASTRRRSGASASGRGSTESCTVRLSACLRIWGSVALTRGPFGTSPAWGNQASPLTPPKPFRSVALPSSK
jgi:hypothetical protein